MGYIKTGEPKDYFISFSYILWTIWGPKTQYGNVLERSDILLNTMDAIKEYEYSIRLKIQEAYPWYKHMFIDRHSIIMLNYKEVK